VLFCNLPGNKTVQTKPTQNNLSRSKFCAESVFTTPMFLSGTAKTLQPVKVYNKYITEIGKFKILPVQV